MQIWQVTDNKLTFTNSYKMKLSVILGVLQMLFGVLLSLFNHRFFHKPLRIWHEFIPQTLFLSCIFGYLVICILLKWSTPLDSYPNDSAPSLLIMLINMFLRFGLNPEPEQVLYGDKVCGSCCDDVASCCSFSPWFFFLFSLWFQVAFNSYTVSVCMCVLACVLVW